MSPDDPVDEDSLDRPMIWPHKSDREPMLRPRPYNVHRLRIQLLFLFGLLILVGWAMVEAGKPENWAWMGFDRQPGEQNALTVGATATDDSADRSGSVPDRSTSSPQNSDSAKTASPALVLSSETLPSRNRGQVPSAQQQDYPVAATRFWNDLFPSLEKPEQRSLLELTRLIRNGQTPSQAESASMLELVDRIDEQRKQFHQELFDRLTLMANSAADKPALTEQMYESEQAWEKVRAALQSTATGQEIKVGQQQAVSRLQQVLDSLIMNQVEDKTALGWNGDSAAWLRTWELVQEQPTIDAPKVGRIQLVSQPEYYRGKQVKIEGWVRSARLEKLDSQSQLGLDFYYVLWLRPEDTKVGPYCVYTAHLPDAFPSIGESFTDLNQRVVVDGRFFKIQSYIASDKSVQYAPVVIGQRVAAVASPVTASVSSWQPSPATWLWMLAPIPVLAIGLAWWAYRGSLSQSSPISIEKHQQIDSSLETLKDNPTIKTDLERVQELESRQ